MAEVDEWWQNGYPTYSIAKLEEMPVYLRFTSLQAPYDLSIGPMSESLKSDSVSQDYSWENSAQQCSERLTHLLSSDEWTYEHTFHESDCDTTVLTSLSPHSEKGTIRKTYFGLQTIETWEKGPDRRYSKKVEEGGARHGVEAWFQGGEGRFGWVEVHFEDGGAGIGELERVNYHGNTVSGETKHVYRDRSWGETWVKGEDKEERNSWHKQGGREWGHTHGEACGKVWDHHFSTSPGESKEERLLHDGLRYRSFQHHRKGKDFLKVEWEGSEPRKPLDEEPSGGEEDRKQLERAVTAEYDLVLESMSTLRMLSLSSPEFLSDVSPLEQEVSSIPSDPPSLLPHLFSLQSLLRRIELLKRRITESHHVSLDKYQSLHQPLENLACESIETMESASAQWAEEPEAAAGLADLKNEAETLKSAPENYLEKIRSWVKLLQRINEYTGERLRSKKITDDVAAGGRGARQIKGGTRPAGDSKSEEEREEATRILYKIAGTQEASLGRLTDLISDPQEIDDSNEFHSAFSQLSATPRSSILQQLSLLLSRQETLFRLIEKLKGKHSDEIRRDFRRVQSVVETSLADPNLKLVKKRTRSEALPPLARLNQILDSLNSRLVQVFSIIHPDADALDDIELLESGGKRDAVDPVPLLVERTERLGRVSEFMGGYLDRLYRTVLMLDKQMSRVLKQSAIVLSDLDAPASVVEESKRLSEQTLRSIGETLLLTKAKQLLFSIQSIKAGERSLADVIEELTINNDELDELLRQKSEEIVFLTKEIDGKDKKMRERQEELLMLRKFKAGHEENSQALFAAQIKIRDLEVRMVGEETTCSLVEGDVRPHCLRYLLELLRKRRQVEQSVLLHHWLSFSISPFAPDFTLDRLTLVPSTAWPPNIETDYLTEADAKDLEKADLPLASERLTLIRENPLAKGLHFVKLEGKAPVSDYDLYSFIEAAFSVKLARDDEDLFAGVRPCSFPEFLLEYGISVSESKDKGCDHLLRLMISLVNVYRSRQPYAVFVARMIHVLDPHPAVLEGEILALQYWQRLQYARKVVNESLMFGGEIELGEVLDTYYPEFVKDPAILQTWLAAIRPSSLPDDLYGLYLFSWKVASAPSLSLSSLPSPLQRSDFSQFLKDNLDLHLPKTVFNALWTHVRMKTDLTPEKVVGLKSEVGGDVKVADFLNGLLDAHEWQRKRTARRLMHEVPRGGITDKEAFISFYLGLDPSAREAWLSDLADQLMDISPSDPFNANTVIQVLATHPPKPMQGNVLHIERLHSSLETRLLSTLLDTDTWASPMQRIRLIRTTETILKTTRTQLKTRRKS